MRSLVVDLKARLSQIAIVNRSVVDFGQLAAQRYANLIIQGFQDLQASPTRAGAIDIGGGQYLYHLRYTARLMPSAIRVKKPRHVIAYRFDDTKVEVIALLHDSMDIPTRLRGEDSA